MTTVFKYGQPHAQPYEAQKHDFNGQGKRFGGAKQKLLDIVLQMSQTQNMLSACPRPRGKKWDNGMLPDFRNFRVVLISFFQITQNLKTLEICGLLQVVDIFILHKLKKKFKSIAVFFIEIYPVFFIENGNVFKLQLENHS